MQRKAHLTPERVSLTPMIDVAFLVLIFFMALPMRRLDTKLSAYLPKEAGWAPVPVRPDDVIRLRIRDRRGAPVYELGQHRADTPRGLAVPLAALGPHNIYEIHASPGVAWQSVILLVDQLTGMKCERIRFTGASEIPGRR